MNPLLEAVLIGSNYEVKRLLGKFPIDDQDNLVGQSALHLAVSCPHHIRLLLESGADVNAKDRHGITPLMYASAMGNTDLAICLLNAGANPLLKDTLRGRNFLMYARARGHWDTIMAILDYVRTCPDIPEDGVKLWLTMGTVLWKSDSHWRRRSKDLRTLLEWGANPDFICDYSDSCSSETLLHGVREAVELEALVSHGFTKFNHQDGTGAHALISVAQKCDPLLLQLCLEGGSKVNHQDKKGHSALHVIVQHLRSSLSKDEDSWHYENRSSTLDCVDLLVRYGADPFLADSCQCACSQSGCTPLHMVLKESSSRYLNFGKDIWAVEVLNAVEEHKGLGSAKHCLLTMLRMITFEELELTHTCCRKGLCLARKFEEDEIREIMDEEEEMIAILERQMGELESSAGSDSEAALIEAIFRLSLKAQKDNEEAHNEEAQRRRTWKVEYPMILETWQGSVLIKDI
jgi:ankyrin repeat protein